jgi:hypothetical protein
VPEPKPEFESVSIVLVGSFNPAIFHPTWFAQEKLIQREEADRADLKIVSPEVSVFSIGWLGLEVTQGRFAARTTQIQHIDSLRDLVLGTFGLLRHTPIIGMGINRLAHYRSANEEEWHKFGHRLTPKEPWAGILEKPGMRRVEIQGQRTDQFQGRVTVAVEPSSKLKPGFGVSFEVNDHFENDVKEQGLGCERMMEILNTAWQVSLERSLSIMQTIIKAP